MAGAIPDRPFQAHCTCSTHALQTHDADNTLQRYGAQGGDSRLAEAAVATAAMTLANAAMARSVARSEEAVAAGVGPR